ncbi:MAG: ABC transporter permease [Phycisphaerae bacterium]
MRKVLVVAIREYEAAVKTKTFLISVILMPVLMSGGIIAQKFMEGHADTTDKTFAVIDHSGQLLDVIVAQAQERNQNDIFEDAEDGTRRQIAPRFLIEPVPVQGQDLDVLCLQLSDRVRDKELTGFVEIQADILSADLNDPESSLIAYRSANPVYNDFRRWLTSPVTQAVQKWRFEQKGLDIEEVAWALQSVNVAQDQGLFSKVGDKIVEGGADRGKSRVLIGIGLVMMMFMVIALGATPLINVVLEEKSQNIVEVLIGSVGPFELMLGKLLGSVAVSLTVVGVYLVGGYAAAIKLGYSQFLPPTYLIVWFVVFQALAILLFGSMFIAIGAACSDLKEAQSALLPVWLLVCAPLFVMGVVLEEPSSKFAVAASLFPVATPMLMPLRAAIDPNLPLWQPAVGMVSVLLGTIFCVFVAGRVFRIGILTRGEGFKIRRVAGWILKG